MNRIPAGNPVTDSKKIPPLPKIPQTGLFSYAQGSWRSAKSAGDRQADFSRGKSVAFCFTWPSTECIAMCTGAGYGIVVQVKGDVLVAAISDLAGLWLGFSRGDAASRDTLLGLYYEEFRKIARRMLTTDSSRMRLQPTDLVHEAVVRIISGNGVAVRDQNHLLSLAARVMRVTLIDEVRKYKAAKRGDVVTLWPDAEEAMPPLEIEAFDERHLVERIRIGDAEENDVAERGPGTQSANRYDLTRAQQGVFENKRQRIGRC